MSGKESELYRLGGDRPQFHAITHPVGPTDLHLRRQLRGIAVPESAKPVPAIALPREVQKSNGAQGACSSGSNRQCLHRFQALLV